MYKLSLGDLGPDSTLEVTAYGLHNVVMQLFYKEEDSIFEEFHKAGGIFKNESY